VRTLQGSQFEIVAKQFVIAIGGLETPRLLLASRSVHPQGIGNEHDLVGRFYMCHLSGTIGALTLNIPREDVSYGYELTWDGVYCRRRFALRPEAQRDLRVNNVIFRLHHLRPSDPSHRSGVLSAIYLARSIISYEYSKRLHSVDRAGALSSHIFNVAREPFGTLGFVSNWFCKRNLGGRKFPSLIVESQANVLSLEFLAEQQPNPQSRVTLCPKRDRLGMPKLFVDWRHCAGDIATISQALRSFSEELRAWGGGDFRYDPQEVEACALRDGAFGGHHIGTARMARESRQGVVDENCRVHGVSNLYIAGSAVFPTSSQANPTLTIVALALRLADHLKQNIGCVSYPQSVPVPEAA
jgi:choline dehydrogenase-like flavoprotein